MLLSKVSLPEGQIALAISFLLAERKQGFLRSKTRGPARALPLMTAFSPFCAQQKKCLEEGT